MSRRVHNWRVKADDKFKQYFKRWEVFKLCQYRIKEYFESRRNVKGRRNSLNYGQGPQENELEEKCLFERLLLPLLESDKKKCGSLEDLIGQEPVQLNESRKKWDIDASWKRNIKKYKIEGFLCVPSLYKYDPYEPDLLRTTSDTCVRYENYDSRITPPEKRYWGPHKRGQTSEKDGSGGIIFDSRKVRCEKKASVEPISESNLFQIVQKRDDQSNPQTLVEVVKDCHELTSSKGDLVTGNQGKETTSSSSSIDDSMMRKFTRPVCNQLQKQPLSNRHGKIDEALKLTKMLTNLNGEMTKSANSQYASHRISTMKKISSEAVERIAIKTTQKAEFDKLTSCHGRSGHIMQVQPKFGKTTENSTADRFDSKGIVHHLVSSTKTTQNVEFDKFNSVQGTQRHPGGTGQMEEDAQVIPSVQRKFVKTKENSANGRLAHATIGYQHASSVCDVWKPNWASPTPNAPKLSRSIKTSNTYEMPPTPNRKHNFQYQYRRKQNENTGKTLLRVMNYCFEGHVVTPGSPDAALKSENRRLLNSDKVCCGWDGVKKKDRQYGSNFSVKASKSHFDLTTQVLLQAKGFRK